MTTKQIAQLERWAILTGALVIATRADLDPYWTTYLVALMAVVAGTIVLLKYVQLALDGRGAHNILARKINSGETEVNDE